MKSSYISNISVGNIKTKEFCGEKTDNLDLYPSKQKKSLMIVTSQQYIQSCVINKISVRQ